ncbi:uncharacterized protein LOC142224054 [Haematobia irritans]|uniref:uncharacterized protein LOC142224054 n=1 Tax=Haematobia irritans TaxID=7368 RepID=UPI003F4F4E6C
MNISEQSPAFIRSLCRTCMNANATVDVARNTSIFKQYLYEKPTAGKVSQFSLLELLQSVRPDIYSQHEDKLPQVMCLRCIDQLQAAHEYLKMCQESERQFRKLLLPKTTAATSTPVHRAAPPEKEYITDHHVISANVDYPLTVVKEETMDCNAYSQFEISMDKGEHSLMDKESLPSTSGMNDHERFPSCGQSEESEDGGDGGDESWRPPAKRKRKTIDKNKSNQRGSIALDEHPANTNEDGSIPCQVCGKTLANIDLWNEHILNCALEKNDYDMKRYHPRASSGLSEMFQQNLVAWPYSSGNENFYTKEELQEFLENNHQVIIGSFKAKKKLTNIERVKLSKAIVQYLLTNPTRILRTKELEHISQLICEVFEGEIPSTYYRKFSQGRHASGKIHDAYNNYRSHLARSGIIQRRSKTMTVKASSESEADSDRVSEKAHCKEKTGEVSRAEQLLSTELNVDHCKESWRETYSQRRQQLKDLKSPELYIKKYPVLAQPNGYELYMLDVQLSINKPLILDLPPTFVSTMISLVKTRRESFSAILKAIADDDNEYRKSLVSIALLPFLFPPPIVKCQNGPLKLTKTECMDSFINHFEDVESAEIGVTNILSKQTEGLRPFIVFIGSPVTISWLVVGSTKYSFNDIGSCLKGALAAYIALKLEYPYASQKPWFLLQKYIFNISLPADHLMDHKVKTIANDLNLMER